MSQRTDDPSTIILENACWPLSKYYRQDGIEEVFVNRPGEVIVKSGPFQWKACNDPELTRPNLLRMLTVLANITGRVFNDRNPVLYTETKPEGYRVTAIAKHVLYDHRDVEGLAIAIRKTRTQARSIVDFLQSADAHDIELNELSGSRAIAARNRHSDNVVEDLMIAVEKDGAVLISGGMGTGKSNLMMALTEQIPPMHRVITIEDAKELVVRNHNKLHLIVDREENAPDSFTWARGVGFLRRATPDVILPGEVSNENSAALLALMNSGMTNFMTTIHASSAEGAFRAMAVNVAAKYQGGGALDQSAILEILRASIARIVHIEIDPSSGRRTIVESRTPDELLLFKNAEERHTLQRQLMVPDLPSHR